MLSRAHFRQLFCAVKKKKQMAQLVPLALGALLVPLALGALPATTFPLLPYTTGADCADDNSWSYPGKYGATTCDDWYGFHCSEVTANRCGESTEHLEGVIQNCPETCDLCETGISVHGDPMFKSGDRYTKLVMPEGKLQPLVAWNTSDGARCVLHGATVSAGDDDEAETDAQWFTHFRVVVNDTIVMDVSRVVPDIERGQLASKMRVALDQEEIPAALPGVDTPEQHNSANRVVGLKLGTMGKRYIGMHRAERLVLNVGGVPMEITSAAARKFKSKHLQVKFAHFNLHIEKLPAGAQGLIAELKGMQPLSNRSRTYLRQEPHFHVDASKNPRAEVELRQRARKEKHNEYEGLCPGQDSLPPAPPYAPMNLAPLADLTSFTPLPMWCDETAFQGTHDGGHPITPASDDWGHAELIDAGIKYCEQAPNDYTCRQCCDFGLSGPKSVCSSGNRCPGDRNNEVWKASEGCGAQIGVTFKHENEGTSTEICVEAAPVGAECIRVLNMLEWGLAKEDQDECLAMIDKDTIDDLSEEELTQFAAQYPGGLKVAIEESRTKLEEEVESVAAKGDLAISKPGGPDPEITHASLRSSTESAWEANQAAEKKAKGAKGKVSLTAKHSATQAEKSIHALKKAMKTVNKDMHAHHAWQALVSLAKKRRKLPHDYKTDTLDVQVKTGFGRASLTDVDAVNKLLAQVIHDDKVHFCVNLDAVKLLIEEVAYLVDMCVKPSGYQCAPATFCNSEACGATQSHIMLKACMQSQSAKKFELAAFVQHGPGRNVSFNGCEAAEFAIKAYTTLPENAHPEDFLSMLSASHTVVNKEHIVKGLRSMLRARKESRK